MLPFPPLLLAKRKQKNMNCAPCVHAASLHLLGELRQIESVKDTKYRINRIASEFYGVGFQDSVKSLQVEIGLQWPRV